MNKYEFRREIHDYIDNQYDKFLRYQQQALDILKEFHRICQRNNITYYLSDGTLLGAIRDGGAIPWDYDVDVHVPYAEKDKLIEALKRELKREYYIHCPETDSNCRHFFLRVSQEGYNSTALHVDVFYIIGTPTDISRYKKFSRKVIFVSSARYHKLLNVKEESMGRKVFYIYNMLLKVLYGLIPLKILNIIYSKLCNRYNLDESKYYMTADIFGYKRYDRKFNSVIEVAKLGEDSYNIPAGYKDILSNWYDDYKSYPPIKARFNEFMNSLDRLEYFDRMGKKNLLE